MSWQTEDRLRSALQARTATLGEDTLTSRPPSYPGAQHYREPLLPKWGRGLASVLLVAAIVLGAVLGTHSASVATTKAAKLPGPSQPQDLGSDRVQVTINSFTLRDKLLRLEFSAKNLNPTDGTPYSINTDFGAGTGGSYDLSGVYLIVDGRRVIPARTSDDKCFCSSTITASIEPQQSKLLTVTYDAPAALPAKADVTIPNFATFDDVPISK